MYDKQFFFNIEDSIFKVSWWVNAKAIQDPNDPTKCIRRPYPGGKSTNAFEWSGASQAVTATGHGLAATGSAISNVGNAMVSSQQPTVPTAAPVGGKRKIKESPKKKAKRKDTQRRKEKQIKETKKMQWRKEIQKKTKKIN